MAREQIARAGEVLAGASEGGASGVLIVHLRGLRQLVALLGFDAGVALAEAVGARLQQMLRPVDQVLRIAENEFLVLLPGLLSVNHGVLAARKVMREFESALTVQGRSMTPLVTLALATSVDPLPNADQLLRRALVALDGALERNQRLALAGDPSDDLWLQDELRDALINNELSVHFQPVIDLRQRRIVAVEALARWTSPRHGVIAPMRFISLAEQAGLAPELTRWSVHAVLREFAALHRRAPGLRCAINLSPKVFSHSGFEEQIISALTIWDLPPRLLTLEVTETAVMEDPELSSASLRNLRVEGVRIAIDDFGQGYSSFSYLKQFPATELKIDQSFVIPMRGDTRARQLVRSIIDLAHHLDMEAVGEGVEDAGTLEQLAELGCDLAQGYHLGRPVKAAELVGLF